MAETQCINPQIRALQSSPQSPSVVEAISLINLSHLRYCDTSTGTQRPLVPKALCELYLIHFTAHHISIVILPSSQSSFPDSSC